MLTYAKYNALLTKLMRVKDSGPYENKDYALIKKYDVKQFGAEYRIVSRKQERILLYAEEIYDIIEEVHIATRHGGRDQIICRLKPVYENITRELIMLFIDTCDECHQKKKKWKH